MKYQLRLFRDTDTRDEVLSEGPYGILRAKVADAMNSLGEKFDKVDWAPDRWESKNYSIYIVPATEPVYEV